MAKREWDSEARGQDDDGDAPPEKERKVQIDNAYFDKLKARLKQQPESAPVTGDVGKSKGPGFVIYGDDGYPLKS